MGYQIICIKLCRNLFLKKRDPCLKSLSPPPSFILKKGIHLHLPFLMGLSSNYTTARRLHVDVSHGSLFTNTKTWYYN